MSMAYALLVTASLAGKLDRIDYIGVPSIQECTIREAVEKVTLDLHKLELEKQGIVFSYSLECVKLK